MPEAKRSHSSLEWIHRRPLRGVISGFLLACAAGTVAAQEHRAQPISSLVPLADPAVVSPTGTDELPLQTAQGMPSSLSGNVLDSAGALVPGARISLGRADGSAARSILSDSEGRWGFQNVQPGDYRVTVESVGFAPWTSETIALHSGQPSEALAVRLRIPADHADVFVTVTRKELATEELHDQEQQRILGFPDFYTSFVWEAAPLDAGQKLSLGLHATTDRMAFITAALVAGAEQCNNTFPGFGGGPQGFGKRYGAAYADAFVGKFLGAAILPSIFRQDPRYFYMGPENGTVKQRAWHAFTSGFLTRGDNGRLQPNYSHILGNASAGAISTLYHPDTESAGRLALNNALIGTFGSAGVNLAREFLLKRFVRGGSARAGR